MNIYGDNGNVLVLRRRLEWRGIDAKVIEYNPGDTFPSDVDIIIGGGGQDSGQDKIHDDLISIGPKLRKLAEGETPMLVVCGLYQLFGHFFKTREGEIMKGIGLLDAETYGKDERLIGNIVLEGSEFGEIIGYENHSGQTFLKHNLPPLAKVQIGAGNNTEDGTEGARYKNVIGTYLHGSLLPKNPKIADFLIRKAITKKYGDFNEPTLPDHYADKARAIASTRPR
jgi:CobQ-like glutamine amidotransferase family enzyme